VYIVSDRDTRILLECGVSYKKLKQLCGFTTADMAACLISHEHKDHSGCVNDLIAAGMPVYMSSGTAEALELEGAALDAAMCTEHGKQVSVGSIDIVPFATFHDAKEPQGFLFRSRVDGDVLVFATDTVNLQYRFPGVNILAIEANYDKYILERSQRPEKVKKRIQNTHMEIDVLCDYLRSLDLSECREIYLLHLSDGTSHEGHFINKVLRAVPPGIQVLACPK
jgi:phosphoribosyl 1,2-cyclic phosphodiesterase